jgi:hypothetical protein
MRDDLDFQLLDRIGQSRAVVEQGPKRLCGRP